MKEQIEGPEKELSDKEIASLSDADFKTLVIRMLTEMRVRSQNRGRSEGYAKWNKEKYTGNQQWREGNQDSNHSLDQKEEINSQPEQNEETRIQNNEERLRNLWDHFKCSNIQIIGVPEEEEEKEIEVIWKHNEELS